MSTFEKFANFCYTHCFANFTSNFTLCTEEHYVDCAMYPKRILDLEYLVPVTVVLLLIFLSGLMGNLSVCTVILTHPNMRSDTNVYLFSLAVSDVLLLVFGLAPELWTYWNIYGYPFEDFMCPTTKFLATTGTWASAMTVVAFSIERYTAICHHTRTRSQGNMRIAIATLVIWTVSMAIAAPVFDVYRVQRDEKLHYPPKQTGLGDTTSPLTAVCTKQAGGRYAYYDTLYWVTSVLFFFIPMAVLLLVYIKIAVFIRSNRELARSSGIQNNCSENTKIFKVLVAVVLAFFLCGAPFHFQRLTVLPGMENQGTNRVVLVVSGLFYYLSATINPILYNAMSKRYRTAFKEIITFGTKRKNQQVNMNAITRDVKRSSNKTNTTATTGVASSV